MTFKLKRLMLSFLLIGCMIYAPLPDIHPVTDTIYAATVYRQSSYVTLSIGDIATLKLSSITSGITWKSSNKKIVTVDSSGVITAKKRGTTSIIATYKGSSYKWIVKVNNTLLSASKTGDYVGLSSTDLAVLNKAEQIIFEEISSDMSSYEKAKVIHDYLVKNCSYDNRVYQNIAAMPDASYHPEGCLLYQTCVCQGYAETYQLFMNLLGIKNTLISGYATNDAGTSSHAWNRIKLGKYWYLVDVTWDDPVPDRGDFVQYDYFLRDDAFFSIDHTWDDTLYPEATGTSYLMKPYKEFIVTNDTEAKASFEEQLKKDSQYITFAYKTGTSLSFPFLRDYHYKYYAPTERGDYTVYVVVIQ
ncbi:MAG: hypothetical protein PWP24_33 [Clostridiales bacterium]|nr:hypothetical protein [Clostridiales bacterium]